MKFDENEKNVISVPMFENNFVYFLLKQGDVVYVGQTTRGLIRPLSHTKKDYDEIKIIYCPKMKLDFVESEFIKKYRPKYNKQNNYAMNWRLERVRDRVREITGIKNYTVPRLKNVLKKLDIKVEIDYYTGKESISFEDCKKLIEYIEKGVEFVKHTIEGFSQEYALSLRKTVTSSDGKSKEIRIDFTDLVILRWFVDFFPNMRKMTVDGKEYAWLSHEKMLEDLPLLDISRRACIDRMQKLVEFGLLDYKIIKDGGTFSLYAFGENYSKMVGGSRSNEHGVVGQTHTKDKSINNKSLDNNYTNDYRHIDNNKIINNNIYNNIYIYIIYYLNSITKNNYDVNHSKNKELILELLSKGYTQDDLTAVVDTMNAIWKGTDKAQYLRPTTLFDPEKFPKYLERSRKPVKPATPFHPNPLPQPPTPAKCISSPYTKGGKRQPNFDVDDFFAKALARSDAELAKYGKDE